MSACSVFNFVFVTIAGIGGGSVVEKIKLNMRKKRI